MCLSRVWCTFTAQAWLSLSVLSVFLHQRFMLKVTEETLALSMGDKKNENGKLKMLLWREDMLGRSEWVTCLSIFDLFLVSLRVGINNRNRRKSKHQGIQLRTWNFLFLVECSRKTWNFLFLSRNNNKQSLGSVFLHSQKVRPSFNVKQEVTEKCVFLKPTSYDCLHFLKHAKKLERSDGRRGCVFFSFFQFWSQCLVNLASIQASQLSRQKGIKTIGTQPPKVVFISNIGLFFKSLTPSLIEKRVLLPCMHHHETSRQG